MKAKQRLKRFFCIIGLLFFSLYSVDSIAVVIPNAATVYKSTMNLVITQRPVFSNSYMYQPELASRFLYESEFFLTKTYPYILKTKYGSIIISNSSQEPKDVNDIEDGDIRGTVIYETRGGIIRTAFTNEIINGYKDADDFTTSQIMEEANKGVGGRDAVAALRLLANLEMLGVEPEIATNKVIGSMIDPKKNKPDNILFEAAKDAELASDALRKAGLSVKDQIALAATLQMLGCENLPGHLTPENAAAIDRFKKGKRDEDALNKLVDLVSGPPSSGSNNQNPENKIGQIPGFGNPRGSNGTVPQSPNPGNSNTNSSGSSTNTNTGNTGQNSNNSNRNSSTDKMDKVTNVGGGGRQQTGTTGTKSGGVSNSSGTSGTTYTVTKDMYTTENGSVVVEFKRSGGNDGNDGNYATYYYEDADGWHYYVENSNGEWVGGGDKAPPKTAEAGQSTTKVVDDEAILPGTDPKNTETTPRDDGPPLPPILEAAIKSEVARFKELMQNGLWKKGNAGSTNTTPTPDGTDGRQVARKDGGAILRSLGVKKMDMIGNPGTSTDKPKNIPSDINKNKPGSKDDGRTDPPRN